MRSWVEHTKGSPVVDGQSGWSMRPGDDPKRLPKSPGADIISALRSGVLKKCDRPKPQRFEKEVAAKAAADKAAADKIKKDLKAEAAARRGQKVAEPKGYKNAAEATIGATLELIATKNKALLTNDGKPEVEALKVQLEKHGFSTAGVDSKFRDKAYKEATKHGDSN